MALTSDKHRRRLFGVAKASRILYHDRIIVITISPVEVADVARSRRGVVCVGRSSVSTAAAAAAAALPPMIRQLNRGLLQKT